MSRGCIGQCREGVGEFSVLSFKFQNMTPTKRKFISLREKLLAVSDAFESVEQAQEAARDRLIGQIDAVLGLLGQMLEQHEGRAEVVRDIRDRIDSTLDERLRLSAPLKLSRPQGLKASTLSSL